MQDFLSLHNADCFQFSDRRYEICLLRHYLVDILIGKPTFLRHVVLFLFSKDHAFFLQVNQDSSFPFPSTT